LAALHQPLLPCFIACNAPVKETPAGAAAGSARRKPERHYRGALRPSWKRDRRRSDEARDEIELNLLVA